MKKILSTILITIAIFQQTKAQSDAMISNYMFSQLSYNPACAGISKNIDASLLARQQWVGLDNAPSTQILNFNNSTKNLGNYGLSLINDRLGYENTVNLRFIYAYPVRLSKNSYLSAGFGAGFINRSLDGTKLKYENRMVVDPNGEYALRSEFKPALDFGMAFQNKRLTIGLSSTHVPNNVNDATFYNIPRHYYLFASYKIKLNNKLNLEPSIFVKSSGVNTQLEGNTNLVILDRFWIGASYRQAVSWNVLAGMKLNKYLSLAYAYDFDTGKINTYSSGSHEIMLRMSIKKNEKEDIYFKTPRLFN